MKKILIVAICSSFLISQTPYFQQDVAYDIKITLNDSAHSLNGFQQLSYTNNSPEALDYIWFHLWPNAYKNDETALAKQLLLDGSTRFHFSKDEDRGYIDVEQFIVNGQNLEIEFHPDWIDVVKVHLTDPLAPGATVNFEIPFYVKLPLVFSRLGHTGKHYEITQWYPKPAVYDRDGWHPMPYLNRGEFYSEFGTFDVHITLPKDYRVMATGDILDGAEEYAWLDSLAIAGDQLHDLEPKAFKKSIKKLSKKSSSDDQLKTLHFHQENVHDFAWFADKKWIVRKGELWLEDSTRSVTLWSMYLPKNAELWENSIEYIHDAGYWYSEFFLDYPYNHITAVDGDLSAGGGMEYPNITVISSEGSKDFLEYVIMHEVGHNWLYGIIGNNERDHAWLDEGLNEYANTRYWEKKYYERETKLVLSDFVQKKLGIGKHLSLDWLTYVMYQTQAVKGDDQPIDMTSEDFENFNYGAMIYMKTGIFTWYLQHYLGENKIDEIMHEFFDSWKFKHPSPGDLKYIFDKHTDSDLSWYFDGVINDTKVIDYSIKSDADGYLLTNNGSLTLPVEVAFYNDQDEIIESNWYEGISTNLTIPGPDGTVRAQIDPSDLLPDIDRSNNVTKKTLDLKFVLDQPRTEKQELFWVPWVFNGNVYNGWTPGLLLYNGFIPSYNYGISLKPMWDTENSSLVGSVHLKKIFYQILGFRSIEMRIGYSDYSGRNGVKASFEGLLRQPIFPNPNFKLNATLFTHSIKEEAVNPLYYSSGDFTIGNLGLTYTDNSNPLFRYDGKVEIETAISDANFAKVNLSVNLQYRHGKSLKTKVRGWVGSILNDDDLPNQYRNYLSGGVDPNFESSFILNRTFDDGKGYLNIYEDQYSKAGPGLHGLALDNGNIVVSSETAWGVNLVQYLPSVPFTIFVDVAGATDLNDSYLDAGLSFQFGPLAFHIPFYQSWDEHTVPNNKDWIKDRIRFEIDFSRFSFGIGG